MTISDAEVALLDTNVLIYAADRSAAFHEVAEALCNRGLRGEVSVAVSPQILMEFFAVITSPRRVARPQTPAVAREEMRKWVQARTVQKIFPTHDAITRVLMLLEAHPNVTQQDIFDCHLVATMQANAVTRIYTYNRQHFLRFEGIDVLTP